MRKWILLVLGAMVLVCATPLASARTLAFGDNPPPAEATSASGATVFYDDGGFTCTPASGSTFPIGDTPVTCDDPASTTLTVTVVDTTAPVVTPPADVTVPTGDPTGTNVAYGSGSATDAVAGSPPVSCPPGSGSHFDPGPTTVTCSATDGYGNTGTATFTVTVNVVDSTAPTIFVPGTITAEATGLGGAAVSFSVTATDLIDPAPTVSCLPSSGATFPIATTQVSCTAKDAANNTSAPQTFNVNVVDTTAPAFTTIPSGTVTQEATGPTGASYSFSVAAFDAVTTSPTINCDHNPAGATYSLGPTPVSCTATDAKGNSTTQGFVVKIVDTAAPTITLAPTSPVLLDATTSAGASYSFTVTAVDANGVDSSPAIICSRGPSAETYPIGTTPVSCTAKDASNNSSPPRTFNVVVSDRSAPTLTVPATITREATGPSGAVVTFTPTATDLIDPAPTILCSPSSGATFSIATTPVSCTAKDASNNTSAPKTFNVTVVDTTAPVIPPHANITAEATGPSGATVTYPAVTATDTVDGTISANCAPASGSTFNLGSNTVTCNATDANRNPARARTFTITVVDTTAPAFSGVPAPFTVEANGPSGSIASYARPTAADLVDGLIAGAGCLPLSGSLFAIGSTTVNCKATDVRGNTGRASFNVTVADRTGPNLIVPVSRSVYATTPTGVPNTVSGVVAFLTAASATDIVDPNPVVTNNAPPLLPLGTTDVTFTARDASGNLTFRSSALVVLPQPPADTPPLVIPPAPTIPAEVTNVKVTPLDGAARIQWSAGGRQVMVTRSTSATRSLSSIGDERVVYTGTGSSYTDRGLTNGVEYRYVVMAVDAAGNHSAGVAAVIVPRRNLLRSPKDGALLKKAPKLLWALDAEAQYYNAQLLLDGKKILSVWPLRPTYVLKKSWKFEGRKYTLKPGVYTWFVWPGYGARSAVDYGELMGSRTFRVVR